MDCWVASQEILIEVWDGSENLHLASTGNQPLTVTALGLFFEISLLRASHIHTDTKAYPSMSSVLLPHFFNFCFFY